MRNLYARGLRHCIRLCAQNVQYKESKKQFNNQALPNWIIDDPESQIFV